MRNAFPQDNFLLHIVMIFEFGFRIVQTGNNQFRNKLLGQSIYAQFFYYGLSLLHCYSRLK